MARDSSHNKAQRLGKERDCYIYQACGSTVEPEGHHIIDYQYGGRADSENIITLCRSCHKQVHRGKLDVAKF